MKKSSIVYGKCYVISLWSMVEIAWLAADSCGQSRSVSYLCTLVLDQRTFSSWGCGTNLVRGVVGPSGSGYRSYLGDRRPKWIPRGSKVT